ncbi:hypothetical protein DKZ29_07900 [Limosilactobacillus reuteri]|uniref:phage tail tape measure protein n=1 Tax=Limosilactobacillus reuteri TaxID=1598 RepID=UPI000D6F92D2|nr:phage tail tape measure protein [Limosilactobacillus reuteri]PWT34581.1 hypothetical protein DKZ24_08135 [Limosilactobacillus reuteri]PWT57651.1 hypothetical protein DKZ29_07900 [Limosilactobacillus reuteri]PWT58449.1 hypothetical protein DKZ30_08045 [Limosilactobacillus reuteri]PWT65337.1 hypothetical protein DKZ28_08145 [Limosilactobacillus reuteri]
MADGQNLNIRVHVDLPDVSDIRSEIESAFRGLGDIDADIDLKSAGLRNIKSKIREALGKENYNINAKADVDGLANIERLKTQLTELKRLAREPIRIKTEMDPKSFADAQRKMEERSKKQNRAFRPYGYGEDKIDTKADISGLEREKAILASVRKLQKQINATELKIAGSGSSSQVAIMKGHVEELKGSLDGLQKKLSRVYSSKEWALGKNSAVEAAARSVGRVKNDVISDQAYKVALKADAQRAREQNAAVRRINQLLNQRVRLKTASLKAGEQETAVIEKQVAATNKQLASVKQVAKERGVSAKVIAEAERNSALSYSRNAAKYEDRQAQVIASGRGVGRGSARRRVMNFTMDAWNTGQQAIFGVGAVVSQLNDVDKAITKVTKVVPDGQAAVNKWKKNIYRDATAVGKTAPEFANAVEQWATAGYNLKQSIALAKTSVMGSFVGDVPVEDMVKYMSVPLKAFQKEGLRSKDIINAMNEVSNKHAIEMDDLGMAYQRASSTVAGTGTTFAQLTGIITAAQEGTREGGDKIGNAYKTIAANINQIGSGITKQAQNKNAFFESLGVQLKDSKGNLKSTYQVMDQLSKKWKHMSAQDKNTAALYAAGKDHANIFSATMDNWDTAKRASREAQLQQNLANPNNGSAYKEFAKQQDSIEFHLARLKNSWGELLNSLAGGRSGVNAAVDTLNGLLKVSGGLANNKLFMTALKSGGILAASSLLNSKLFGGSIFGMFLKGKSKWAEAFQQGLQGINKEAKTTSSSLSEAKKSASGFAGSWSNFKNAWAGREEYTGRISRGGVKAEKLEGRRFDRRGKSIKVDPERLNNVLSNIADDAATMKINKANKALSGTVRIAKKAPQVSRFSSIFRRLGATAGLIGAALPGVGLAIDGVTLGLTALNVVGIDPFKAMDKAMHPAKYAAQALNKEVLKTADSIDKTNAAIGRNGLVSGQWQEDYKAVKDMRKTLDGISQDANGNFTGKDFSDYKKQFNDIAKRNGLELRLGSNSNADVVRAKTADLNKEVKQKKRDNVADLGNKADKQISNIAKSLSGKSIDKLLNANKAYNDKMRDLTSKYTLRGVHGENLGIADRKGYNREKEDIKNDYRFGKNNEQLWNSKQGRQIAANVRAAQKGLRAVFGSYGDALADGTIKKSDLAYMSDSNKHNVAMGAVKNVRDLQGANENDKSVQDAKNNLKMVLKSLGVGAKLQNKIFSDAFKGKNGSLLGDLSKAGVDKQTIAAMAGIGAQYQQQWGREKFLSQAQKDQSALDKYQSSYKNAANAQSLINANTGFIDYDKLAKFNSGYANQSKGRAMFGAAGVKLNKGKPMSVDQMLALTQGMDGDPTKLLTGFAKGGSKTSAATIAAIVNNGQKYKVDKSGNVVDTGYQATGSNIGSAIARGQAGQSRSKMLTGLDEAKDNGQITAAQADASAKWINKNINSKGQAKTVAGYNAQAKGKGKLTENQFKQLAKGLSNAERQQAAKNAKKNGQLTDSQYKDLKKFLNNPKNKQKTDSLKDDNGSKREKSGKSKNKGNDKGNSKKNNHSSKNNSRNNRQRGQNKPRKKSLAERSGLEKRASADTNARTAKAMAKQLRNKKKGSINAKTLKNLQARMKNNKEREKLARQLQKQGKLTRGASKSVNKKYGKPKKSNRNSEAQARKNGQREEQARQKGKDSVKKRNQAKEKAEENKKVRNARKNGQKEARAKAQGSKGATKKKTVARKSTPKRTTNRSAKSSSRSSNKELADAKKLQKQLKSLSKGNHKIKITANVSGAKSKIKSLEKSVKSMGKGKHKIKVTANVSGAKSKIKSLEKSVKSIGKGNHRVKVTASVSGKGKITSLKSALKGLHNRHVKVSVSSSGAGKVKSLKSAINGVHNKHVEVAANVSGTSKVRQLKSAINGVKSKHVSVTAKVSGIGEVRSLASAIASVHSKSVTVSATKIETTIKKTKNGSVATVPQQATNLNEISSMSVVSNPNTASMIAQGAQMMGLDPVSVANGQKVTNYSDSTEKVSEDYWRYMGNELYTGLPLDEQVNKLEGAVTQADENMDKLISLARQRIDLDNKQISHQRTMQSAYQQQITDMINKLHGYGFKSSGNQITNLKHAKDITGDNASKVDELLGKYQSAYQNFSQATQKIQELQTDVWQQGKNQEDYRNTKDQKMVEKLQRELELVTTAIDNQKNILEREGSSLEDGDYRMKLKNNSDQIYAKSDAVQQLLAEFNQLSVTNFVGTKDADNAKNLAESLSQIRDSIMENLDSIDELKKSIHDIQLNSIIESLSKYTDNLNDSIDRLKNNVSNLQDGLLSGTSYNDLMSSNFDVVNLNQKSAYEKSVADKISLERQLDSALDQFARKNVDRTAQVANDQLQIEAQKYNNMLSMAINYARGARNEVGAIDVKYNVSVESDKIEVPNLTHNQEYVQSSIAYQKEMNELKAEYNRLMGEANTAEQKEAINSEMIYKQLELQEKVYKSMIEADKKAINDLREQMKNPDMTTEQLKTITDQIADYEKNVIDAQNNIKDAVKSRFEYEKTQIDKQIDDYRRFTDYVSDLVSIADALHLDGNTQAGILQSQYDSTYREYNNYLSVLQQLRKQQGKYEKNSFEYNQLKAMIDDYESSLNSTVTSLLDITKNQFNETLQSIQDDFEKNVNDGMTANQAKFFQDTWYTDIQKQLKLEEMRLKIVDLEDKTVEKRLAALDAQKQMSKSEADYVDKQIDLALAQQKLNNTLNKKDVRYLQKDENGKFNWTYIADQDQVQAAQQEVNQAKQAIEEAKISARNEYTQQIEEIVSDIQDGKIDQSEGRSRINQAYQSKEYVLKDIPGFDKGKADDIINAYDKYIAKNRQIMKDYSKNSTTNINNDYQQIVKGFGDQFKMVSRDLGEIFGKEFRDILNLPANRFNETSSQNKSIVVENMKVELPNVENPNDFAKAMQDLPALAKQYANSKH